MRRTQPKRKHRDIEKSQDEEEEVKESLKRMKENPQKDTENISEEDEEIGHISSSSILIGSWNIDGLQRVLQNNKLQDYFNTLKPDILCLNEVKTEPYVLEGRKVMDWLSKEYHSYFNHSKRRKSYSGVAVLTRYKPLSVEYGMGIEKHDLEGRMITLEFETFYLVAVYVPLSGSGFKRLPYRINEWDPALRNYLGKLKEKKNVIACGDFNVAHEGLDMWEESGKYIGSFPKERESFGKLLKEGFVDTFRKLHPKERKYSWWDLEKDNRTKNLGRRFDYILVNEEAIDGVKEARVNNDVFGSDHCPVELVYNPNHKDQKKK